MEHWNREAAEQCINVGKRALSENDDQKATRMFLKAKRLNPTLTDTVNILLEQIKKQEETKTTTTQTTHKKKEEEKKEEKREYTKEQDQECKKLMKITNFYEILSIEKTTNKRIIKKAYKKSALKFHPDRNQHPLATECFKKVGRAYLCLSDDKKRQIYDQYGVDNMKEAMMRQQPRYTRRHPYYYQAGHHDGEQDEFDFLEEMLREMMGQPRFYPQQRRHFQRRSPGQQASDPIRSACGMILVFILLCCTMFMFSTQLNQTQQQGMNPWQSSTLVDFKQSDIYSVKRQSYHHTKLGIIEYYTKPSIQNELRRNPSLTRQLDDQAFQALPHFLRYHCAEQREQRKQKLVQAKIQRDLNKQQQLLADIENTKLFYCDRLKAMFNHAA
mmetsp:Transcript_12156/g.18101  ORF Transcript_12156/g.18101 Transcript_12156/m.18101 type:complete len:386 (-) Transcript_12156:2014-3171(-)